MTSFNDILTISRSSAAGRVNQLGVFEMVSANQPRFDYDPLSLAVRGLLVEEQRTNLIANSHAFDLWSAGGSATVSANSGLAPDGSSSADVVTLPSGSAIIGSSLFSVAAGALHAFSVYARRNTGSFALQFRNASGTQLALANINTSSQAITAGATVSATISALFRRDAPAGYDRYVMVASLANAESGTARVGISGAAVSNSPLLWGAMVETGPFETSFIPTTTTQVTRLADVVAHTTLSPWFNGVEGTMLIDAYPAGQVAAAAPYAWELRNAGAAANRIALFQQADGAPSGVVAVDGVSSAAFVVPSGSAPTKWALAYKANDFAFCVNGGAVSVDTSGAVPIGINAGAVGASVGISGRYWNGHIRRLKFFPYRLAAAELQAFTS